MVRGQELPTAYVHAKFEDRSFFRLRNIEGVPKFRNWVTYPRPRPRSFIRLGNIGTFRCGALIDPVTLTFDLLSLKSVWESLPCAKFRLPRPFGFRVRADVRDIRRTDRQTDDGRRSPLNAPAPPTGQSTAPPLPPLGHI